MAVHEESKQASGKKFDPSKFILPGAILIAALLISGSLVFYSITMKGDLGAAVAGGGKNAVVDVSVDDDPMLGNPKAKITLVEFSDFQCPFCRALWSGAFQQIKKEYIDTGKAKLVYRDFPLSFHPGAVPAAEGAQCANDQGKFWEFHDKVFEEQAKQGGGTIQFSENDVSKWAGQVQGLDMGKWAECFASRKYKEEVEKDLQDGTNYGVSGRMRSRTAGIRNYGKTDWSPTEGEHASIEDLYTGTKVYANLILEVCNRTREELGINPHEH